MVAQISLMAGWVAVLVGIVWGAVIGMRFHAEGWLGGYGSWQRRMLRLAHVSWFGLGMLDIGFALTIERMPQTPLAWVPCLLLILGTVSMPAVCTLSAFHPAWRRLFALPVGAVLLAVVFLLLFLLGTVPSGNA